MKWILLFLLSFTAFANSPVIWGPSKAKNLTNEMEYQSGVSVITGTLDPSSTAVNAAAGSMYISTNGSTYLKQDSGSTTNWLPLGIAAAGSISTINGQSGPTVSIAAGSSGTDFAVSASANTITLNIPTASGTNRGLLSPANWTTFNSKEPAISAGTTGQYWRGDKTWQTLDKTAVGLPNVDNTSDANKPISTATQTALDLKADQSAVTTALAGKEDTITLLPLAKGGTNKNISAGLGKILYTDADSVEALAAGSANKVLMSNGAAAPSWEDVRFPMDAQNGASTSIASSIQVPESQLTERGGGKWLVETGNKNLLSNPGFEHTTFSTGWTLSAGSGAAEAVYVVEGIQSYKVSLTAQTLAIYQDSEAHAAQFADGVQGVASVRIKTSLSGLSVCPRLAGVTQTSPCATVNSDNKWMLYKVPFVLGATSNGIAIVSSGNVTGDVYVDDAYLGTDAGIADVSVITPWQSYTPTFTGFGTVTCSSCMEWRQVGQNIEIRGKFVSGTSTATEARMTLPGSYTVSAIPSIQAVGSMDTSNFASTLFAFSVLAEPGAAYVTFGRQSSTTDALTKANGSTIDTSGSLKTFSIKNTSIPIANLDGSTQVFASQCGAACEDVFRASVNSAGVVTEGNGDFINGNCTLASTNQFTCDFVDGVFTVTPRCFVQAIGTISGGRSATVASPTTTELEYSTWTSGSTAGALNTSVTCMKMSQDHQSTRTIVGSFKEVVTAPGITKPKTCYAAWGGASATLASPTECTTGTCVEVRDTCGSFSPPRLLRLRTSRKRHFRIGNVGKQYAD